MTLRCGRVTTHNTYVFVCSVLNTHSVTELHECAVTCIMFYIKPNKFANVFKNMLYVLMPEKTIIPHADYKAPLYSPVDVFMKCFDAISTNSKKLNMI